MGLREDLASRLSWGLVFQIKALTDDEKKQRARESRECTEENDGFSS